MNISPNGAYSLIREAQSELVDIMSISTTWGKAHRGNKFGVIAESWGAI